MKKTILGLAIGAGAVYLCKHLYEKGYLTSCENQLNRLSASSRKNIRNVVDAGKNEAEYLKERAEFIANKGKETWDNVMG